MRCESSSSLVLPGEPRTPSGAAEGESEKERRSNASRFRKKRFGRNGTVVVVGGVRGRRTDRQQLLLEHLDLEGRDVSG